MILIMLKLFMMEFVIQKELLLLNKFISLLDPRVLNKESNNLYKALLEKMQVMKILLKNYQLFLN